MTNQTTLITGSSRGIGYQIAIDLIKKNHFVIFTCLTVESFKELRKKLHSQKIKSTSYAILPPIDLSKKDDVYHVIKLIKDNFEKIDNVIFNAGITCRKPFKSLEIKDLEKVFDVNVNSSILMTKEFFDIIQKRIVFIGSISGNIPDSVSIPYGTSKGTLEILTKYLAKEFADKKVTVNTLAPGYTMTNWHLKKSMEQMERIKNKILLKRFATTSEISHACQFLLENDYINGQTLYVDGGFNLG